MPRNGASPAIAAVGQARHRCPGTVGTGGSLHYAVLRLWNPRPYTIERWPNLAGQLLEAMSTQASTQDSQQCGPSPQGQPWSIQ